MHVALKALLILEVIVCFGPLILWWGMGLVFVGIQFIGLFYSFKEAALGLLMVSALVAAGTIGLMALLEVVRSIFNPLASLMNPKVTLLFAVIGLMPVIWIVGEGEWATWKLIGVVAMIGTLHIVFLGRHYLFSGFRDRA